MNRSTVVLLVLSNVNASLSAWLSLRCFGRRIIFEVTQLNYSRILFISIFTSVWHLISDVLGLDTTGWIGLCRILCFQIRPVPTLLTLRDMS